MYNDTLSFEIIKMPGTNIVLGKSWLDMKNPTIDWPTGTMEFRHQDKDIKLISNSKDGRI